MPMYRKCSHCSRKIIIGQQCDCEVEYKRKYTNQYYKNVRNNKENKKFTQFYNSISWRIKSKEIKGKHNNLCVKCLLDFKRIRASDVTHHIETLKSNWEKRLEDNNLIPLCHDCHNDIDHDNYTEEERDRLRNLLKEYRKIYID